MSGLLTKPADAKISLQESIGELQAAARACYAEAIFFRLLGEKEMCEWYSEAGRRTSTLARQGVLILMVLEEYDRVKDHA